MLPAHLDFKTLKRTVSIRQVLVARGLASALRAEPGRLVGPCPLHGGDNPRAFVVDTARNIWFCFTRCGAGGDLVDLVRRLDGCGHRDAARYLASLARAAPPSPPPPAPSPPKATGFRPFTRRLPLDPDVPFLHCKGIRPHTARHYEAGAWHAPGFLERCIGVRLHDTDGRPLGYAGRRLDIELAHRFGKWKLPPRLPKNRLLFNFHRCPPARHHGLVVVECPWAVMRLAQLRVPAVALMGVSLSEHQRLLLATFPRLALMLDGDSAGRTAAIRIRAKLPPAATVHIIELDDGLDPDDLSDTLLRSHLPASFLS